MRLLIPLGLLALLSLLVLLLIYIIRPNFTQRYVSSTYIWKLSLRYRRRRVPVNKIRNILIIICQVLILAACAMIIAEPVIVLQEDLDVSEVIIVMDYSASMRAENVEGTRFERAATEAKEYAEDILDEGGYVSLVRAAGDAEYLAQRVTKEDDDSYQELLAIFDDMIIDVNDSTYGCGYGTTDMQAAIDLCEEGVLRLNPNAAIRIYTDETYTYIPEGIEVVNVADEEGEWNAAIVDAYTEKMDGYYILYVDVCTYGRSDTITVNIDMKDAVSRASGADEDVVDDWTETVEVPCEDGEIFHLMFVNSGTYATVFDGLIPSENYLVGDYNDFAFFSFKEIEISIQDADDSYSLDDVFYVYGGQMEDLYVMYASTETNVFVTSALSVMQNVYVDTYNMIVEYHNVDSSTVDNYTHGYDLYIFEHIAPSTLPTDGVVFLFDPDSVPSGAGFTITDTHENVDVNYWCYLSETDEGARHPLMNNIVASDISLSKASLIQINDDRYTTLMDFSTDKGIYPGLFVADDADFKVIVMPFSVHYSNIAMLPEFVLLFNNIFSYFFPVAMTQTTYNVGDYVSVNINRKELQVWIKHFGEESESLLSWYKAVGDGTYELYDSSETSLGVYVSMPVEIGGTDVPGTYTLIVTSYFLNDTGVEDFTNIYFFVRVSPDESNIFSVATALNSPYVEREDSEYFWDLLLYFAIALVALVILEWILHMFEGL